MAKTFHLTIAQIGHNIFDGDAIAVTLPGEAGVFTVLANHESFVSPLKEGEARIETPSGEHQNISIPAGGIAEVSGNQATIIL